MLCLHDCLVLVQEGAHVLQLIVSEDLELLKVGSDFIWRWDSTHLVDAGLEQLVLALDDALEVSEQLLHLGHRGHAFLVFKHWICALLVKHRQLSHSFVYICHELFQLLEIQLELVNDFISVLFKVKVQ